jgi:DNA-binding XRE family transcriptional regulator
MAILKLDQDPRTKQQIQADAEVLNLVENGEFFDSDKRLAGIELIKRKRLAAREKAAQLGQALGQIRDFLGITQEALASAIGSNKTSISRLESGRYGGISVEVVLSICNAFSELADYHKANEAVLDKLKEVLDQPETTVTTKNQ